MIQIIQKKIETFYRLYSCPEISRYLLDLSQFKSIQEKNSADPQVLYMDDGSDVSLGVYLGEKINFNIHRSPKVFSFQDFCVMAEEVSHYIYLIWSKCNGKKTNLLDLEIQGEIDKFLLASDLYKTEASIFEKMFSHCEIRQNINGEDRARYFEAHRLGKKLISYFRKKKLSKTQKANWLRVFYRQNFANRISMIEHGLH